MDELKVVVEQKSGVISFDNFEELKEKLNGYLEQYREAKFTEESKTFAKGVVSELRKLKKAVNDRKIEVKKAYMQPYEEFEAKTKELLALIDEPIGLIDSQLKAFEEKRIQERRQMIEEIYQKMIGELEEYAPLDRIYSTKWENASTSKKKIEMEMEQTLSSIYMDIQSLKLMRVEPDVIEFALGKYKDGDTAVEAMRMANEFAELMDKRKREEEEAERRRLEEAAKPAPLSAPEREAAVAAIWGWPGEAEPEPVDSIDPELPFVTPSSRAKYQVYASEEELKDLELYMNSVGITFERMG